jgi:phage terminase large subunit-like protein
MHDFDSLLLRFPYALQPDIMGNYPDRVTAFAEEVVSGRIPSGTLQRQACERHLRDLARQNTPDFPYYFDPDEAHVLIDFLEALTILEGDTAEQLQLYGFQDFIFGSWHGWKRLDGYRRFRTSYIEVARQNGKSIGNAGPSAYYGNFDGYAYPQVYCTATKELQAKIVLKEIIKFINADEELRGVNGKGGLFSVKEYASKIICNVSQGEIRALGRDTNSIDGFRPYFASVDEYHKHKDSQMYKLLVDGTNFLKECMISVITTAGFDLTSPCYELAEYCIGILSGAAGLEDETQFVFICRLDEEDDIWDEDNWIKANPLWTEQRLLSLRASAKKAKLMQGEELRNFMTKSLNIWVQFYGGQYIRINKWKECESETKLDDMRGKECILGLDLSSGGDLTTGVLEFPIVIEGSHTEYHLFSHSWIPAARVAEHVKTDKAPYDMWIRDGLLTPTHTMGGVKTDYKYIIAYYKRIIQDYGIKLIGIAYDPHNADAFLHDLSEFGCDLVEITQSARSLNDATVDFQLEVEAVHVRYNKSEKLMTWSIKNAKTTSNSFEEIKVDKEPNAKTKRIDPVDAIIDAHKLTLAKFGKQKPSVYEERGVRTI